MNFQDLPFDIKLRIALESPEVWRTMVSLDSDLGRYSLGNGDPNIKEIREDIIKMKFAKNIINNRGDMIEDYYQLPNGNSYGPYKETYKTGKLHVLCFYKDDKLEGKYETWYENGQIWISCFYKDDKRNGIYEAWYENGQIWVSSFYRTGRLEGKYEMWYEKGKIKKRCFYFIDDDMFFTQGWLEGEYEEWYENEQPSIKAFYHNGKPEGEYVRWDSEGKVIEHTFYD